MIAIIDYGMGNVFSVKNACEFLGEEAIVTRNPGEIARSDRLILPGVGAFGEAMENLRDLNLVTLLHEEVLQKKKPILGICLGMQLMASQSEEKGNHGGLGWVAAKVVRFPRSSFPFRVPHVGWNEISPRPNVPFFANLKKDRNVYFVHSYHLVPENNHEIAATCSYGIEFCASVWKENIFATQFHPEKSQNVGLSILESFLEWSPPSRKPGEPASTGVEEIA